MSTAFEIIAVKGITDKLTSGHVVALFAAKTIFYSILDASEISFKVFERKLSLWTVKTYVSITFLKISMDKNHRQLFF